MLIIGRFICVLVVIMLFGCNFDTCNTLAPDNQTKATSVDGGGGSGGSLTMCNTINLALDATVTAPSAANSVASVLTNGNILFDSQAGIYDQWVSSTTMADYCAFAGMYCHEHEVIISLDDPSRVCSLTVWRAIDAGDGLPPQWVTIYNRINSAYPWVLRDNVTLGAWYSGEWSKSVDFINLYSVAEYLLVFHSPYDGNGSDIGLSEIEFFGYMLPAECDEEQVLCYSENVALGSLVEASSFPNNNPSVLVDGCFEDGSPFVCDGWSSSLADYYDCGHPTASCHDHDVVITLAQPEVVQALRLWKDEGTGEDDYVYWVTVYGSVSQSDEWIYLDHVAWPQDQWNGGMDWSREAEISNCASFDQYKLVMVSLTWHAQTQIQLSEIQLYALQPESECQ